MIAAAAQLDGQFVNARRPGTVCAYQIFAASSHHSLHVPMGERGDARHALCKKFSATRSAMRMPGPSPSTRAMISPGVKEVMVPSLPTAST